METKTLIFSDNTKNYWIISDLHLGHNNILRYDGRPFSTIKEHDNYIVKMWNESILDTDVVFMLGDFSLSNKYYIENRLYALNGIKYFIKGNHDKNYSVKLFKKYGTLLQPIHKIILFNQLYVLSHFPLESWEGQKSQKSIHVHGHSHSNNLNKIINRYNVAINLTNYMPTNLLSLKNKLKNKK